MRGGDYAMTERRRIRLLLFGKEFGENLSDFVNELSTDPRPAKEVTSTGEVRKASLGTVSFGISSSVPCRPSLYSLKQALKQNHNNVLNTYITKVFLK